MNNVVRNLVLGPYSENTLSQIMKPSRLLWLGEWLYNKTCPNCTLWCLCQLALFFSTIFSFNRLFVNLNYTKNMAASRWPNTGAPQGPAVGTKATRQIIFEPTFIKVFGHLS